MPAHRHRRRSQGIRQAYFEVLADRPEQCATFQTAMTNSSRSRRVDRRGLRFRGNQAARRCRRRPWRLLAAILRRLSGHARRAVRPAGDRRRVPNEQFAGCEAGSPSRPGSFFERVPDGCDAYIMKHIIHDWSDEHCRTILALMRDKLPSAWPRAHLRHGGDRTTRAHARQAARHRDAGDDGGRQGAHRRRSSPRCSPRPASGSAASCRPSARSA